VTLLQALLPDGRSIQIKGREAWALHLLHEAGSAGVTPRENPAPRWSSYVHRLRRRGIVIETVRERHQGAFAGEHGRYVLASTLSLVTVERAP
jgi:hypothetical protein